MLQGVDAFDQVAAVLNAFDFCNDVNRTLWMRLAAMREVGEIDRIILSRALTAAGELGKIGGLSALVDLGSNLPEVPHLEDYALRVKELANRRKLMFAGQAMLEAAANETSPVEEILSSATATLGEIKTAGEKEDIGQSPEDIVTSYPGGAASFLDTSQRAKGLSTGIQKLDELTLGLFNGEMTMIGARPGSGKSALMLTIAQHLCLHPKQRKPVSIFSLEMTAPAILTRLVCSAARVDSFKFRAGFLNADERHRLHVALYDITQSRLKIYDRFGITMGEIEKHIRRDVEQNGTVLAMVDYIGLVGVKKKSERRDLDVADMTRRFKILSGECNIPIVVLSQLSRAGDKRPGSNQKPILSDLRESGSSEQDSDAVWFIYREELVHRDRQDVKGQAEIIVAKSRNGPVGVVKCLFLGQFTTFANAADPLDEGIPEE